MDNSRAWFPETDTVLGAGRLEEVVDLCVDVLGPGQILFSAELGFDQVVAVNGRGDGHLGQAGRDELQHGHLGGRVLHRHSVRSQPEVGGASLNVLSLRLVQVAVEHLLGQRQWPVQPVDTLGHFETRWNDYKSCRINYFVLLV